jgi:hypothetical protein
VRYKDGKTVIKIKGFPRNQISFDDLKKKFYNNEKNVLIKNLHLIKKSNFNLSDNMIDKEFLINNYDKRKFSNDKKYTIPFFYENYEYK